MGIDYLVCPQCREGFPDCNKYYRCYICESISACEYSQCKNSATFKYCGRDYILCKKCYPQKSIVVKITKPNENYDQDLKNTQKILEDMECNE